MTQQYNIFNQKITNKQVFWWLLLITLLAGGLRYLRNIEEPYLKRDSISYLQMSERWAQHGISAAYNSPSSVPPLLPFVIAHGKKSLGLAPETAANIFIILTSLLLPLAVFIQTNALFSNKQLAILAAFLAAIHPYSIRVGSLILRDGPYLSFFMLAIAAATWSISNKKWWGWCFFAIAAALSVLTRKEGVELLIFFFLWIPIDIYLNRQHLKPYLFRMAGITCIVLVIYSSITLPVQLMLKQSHCNWHPFPFIASKDAFKKYSALKECAKTERSYLWKK